LLFSALLPQAQAKAKRRKLEADRVRGSMS
jgi:hypothetical protein